MPPRLTARQLVIAAGLFTAVLLALQPQSIDPSSPPAAGEESAAATPPAPEPPLDPDPHRARARHLAILGADRWQRAGFRGQGVKVAVLDNGFRGYRAQLGRALPDRVVARSFRRDGDLEARDSNHGVLCGEVLHALAPDAELLLANWEPDNVPRFLDAVRWARGQGARVVSCSMVMPNWSDGEGGGAVHTELARIVGDGLGPTDALFVAPAGNLAQRHWSGPFHPDAGRFHAWVAGQIDNPVTAWGGDCVTVDLGWPAGPRYELLVLDTTARPQPAGRPVAMSDGNWRSAAVRFVPQAGHTYAARVRLVDGEPTPVRLVVLGGGLEFATAPGSIAFPGDGAEVVAVGAVTADGRRTPYSGCGPNSPRPKPDCVAPVPFSTLCQPEPFTGTSAAAPQAAGLAALWWSRYPVWTASQVREALSRTAVDLGPPGHDWETGFGLLRLPG
jgi:subtilisin family serine protease